MYKEELGRDTVMKIFISHSSKNFDIAKKFCTAIEDNGYECFIAPRDIRVGHEYAEELIIGLDSSDVFLLILTQEASDSPHVLREVERATSRKIPIIVYKVEEIQLNKSMEYFLMTPQWYNGDLGADEKDVIECIKQIGESWGNDKQDVLCKDIPDKNDLHRNLNEQQKTNKGVILAITSITVAIIVLTIVLIVLRTESRPTTEENDSYQEVCKVKLGDTITIGEYYGEPIKWRVINISDDGEQAVIISDEIITMKAFDAAESGAFNVYEGKSYWNEDSENIDEEIQKQLRGNNSWEESNIRRWLNADTRAVIYEDQIPCENAMSERTNGYNEEAGFLYYFTEEEREAILTTKVETAGDVTEDKVFLLSRDELKWLEEANVSIYAIPSREAKEYDESKWYEVNINEYNAIDHEWWLREPKEGTTCEAYYVNASCFSSMIEVDAVGLEGLGIRPAMAIDLEKINVSDIVDK